jgi:phage shock protein PspC (stress-responsive transcriptional regulator)
MVAQRRLERQNGIVSGVCGGIAAYFGWSTFIVRLVFFILLLPGGLPGLIPYLLLWILMPKKQY